MTFADGDQCTPAAIFPYGATVALNLNSGLILDAPPLLGRVSAQATGDIEWNNGTQETSYAQPSLRYVTQAASATVNGLVGQIVRLNNASQEFSGLVVSVFALEGGTTGKTGDANVVTTEVVLFKTRGGQYLLAAVSSVTVIT